MAADVVLPKVGTSPQGASVPVFVASGSPASQLWFQVAAAAASPSAALYGAKEGTASQLLSLRVSVLVTAGEWVGYGDQGKRVHLLGRLGTAFSTVSAASASGLRFLLRRDAFVAPDAAAQLLPPPKKFNLGVLAGHISHHYLRSMLPTPAELGCDYDELSVTSTAELGAALAGFADDQRNSITVTMWNDAYAGLAILWERHMRRLGHRGDTLHVVYGEVATRVASRFRLRFVRLETLQNLDGTPRNRYDLVKFWLARVAVIHGVHTVFSEMDVIWAPGSTADPLLSLPLRRGRHDDSRHDHALGDFTSPGVPDVRVLGHDCQYEVNIGMIVYTATRRTAAFLKSVLAARDHCPKVLDQKLFTAGLPPPRFPHDRPGDAKEAAYVDARWRACTGQQAGDELRRVELDWYPLSQRDFAGPCITKDAQVTEAVMVHWAYRSIHDKIMLLGEGDAVDVGRGV